jgi:hypothetical protein
MQKLKIPLFAALLITNASAVRGQSSLHPEADESGIFAMDGNDAQHPCITPEQYMQIETRCAENRIAIAARGGFMPEAKTVGTVLLDWPVRAAAGLTDCSFYRIGAYVDENTTASAIQDYDCGTMTYDGHKGTDISTWPYNFYKMDNNLVEVIAAAAGIILDKHDGEFDRNCAATGVSANYVIITHADGSTALYWHMKNGSITTKSVGDAVAAGEYLGVAGSSGSSSGPHLHFEVWNGASSADRIDPYSGNCNSLNATTWWNAQKAHKETAVVKVSVNTTDAVTPP